MKATRRSRLTALLATLFPALLLAAAMLAGEAIASGPPAPIIGGSHPGSSSNDNDPAIYGGAQLGTVVTIYRSADCSGVVAVRGSAAYFWFRGLEVSVPDNSETTFSAIASDSSGATSPCSNPYVYREVSGQHAAAREKCKKSKKSAKKKGWTTKQLRKCKQKGEAASGLAAS